MAGRLFTSESVTEGHPDKIADQISDTVLDAMLDQDPHSRVAVETLVTTGLVVVAGEVDHRRLRRRSPQLVRDRILDDRLRLLDQGLRRRLLRRAGRDRRASPADIAQGVDTGLRGAQRRAPSTRWTSRAPATRA